MRQEPLLTKQGPSKALSKGGLEGLVSTLFKDTCPCVTMANALL